MASGEVGRAYILIEPRTTGFAEQAKSQVSGSLGGVKENVPVTASMDEHKTATSLKSSLGGAVKTALAYAGGIFLASKAFDFAKGGILDAAATQKNTEQIKGFYGDQAKSLIALSDSSASSYGISKSASEKFSAHVALTRTNIGLNKDKAAEMAAGYQKLAGATGLIKGQDPAGYLDKLQMAMLGNTRGLKQMGISITPVQEAQEALTLGIKGTSASWTAGQKAQIVYGVAMQHNSELQKEAKAHSGDLADQTIKLSAEMSNLKEEIGAALLPVVTKLGSFLLDGVSILQRYSTAAKVVGATLGGVIALYGVYRAALIAQTVYQGAATVVTRAWTVATNLQTYAQRALAVAMDLNPFVAIAAVIAVVVLALYELYEHSATAKRIMNEAFAGIKHAAEAVFGWLAKTALPPVEHAITAVVNVTTSAWRRWGNVITSVARSAIGIVTGALRAWENVIGGVFTLIGDLIHGRWSHIWGDVKKVVENLPMALAPVFTTLATWVFHQAVHLGERLISGIVSGLKGITSKVKSTVESGIKSAVDNLNPFSPIEHGADLYIATPITQGTVLALTASGTGLQDQLTLTMNKAIGQTLQAARSAAVPEAKALGTAIGHAVTNGVTSGLAALKSAMTTKLDTSIAAAGKSATTAATKAGAAAGAAASAAYSSSSSAVGGGGSGPAGTASTGAAQSYARSRLAAYGWGQDQWGSLQALWERESGWRWNAQNASSGAYGIPQSLPADKMASAGADWRTNFRTQIDWGMSYIHGRYGTPAGAWAHEGSAGWYHGGGVVPGPRGVTQPAMVSGGEVIFTPDQMDRLSRKHDLTIQIFNPASTADVVNQIARHL